MIDEPRRLHNAIELSAALVAMSPSTITYGINPSLTYPISESSRQVNKMK